MSKKSKKKNAASVLAAAMGPVTTQDTAEPAPPLNDVADAAKAEAPPELQISAGETAPAGQDPDDTVDLDEAELNAGQDPPELPADEAASREQRRADTAKREADAQLARLKAQAEKCASLIEEHEGHIRARGEHAKAAELIREQLETTNKRLREDLSERQLAAQRAVAEVTRTSPGAVKARAELAAIQEQIATLTAARG